jgi:hypothetical protein
MVHLQPILDRAAHRLSGWQGKLLNFGRRKELVKSVLNELPTYLLTTVKPPRKFYSAMDKLRKRFLWAGNQELQGVSARSIGVVSAGHCSMEALVSPTWSGLGEHYECAGSGSVETVRQTVVQF